MKFRRLTVVVCVNIILVVVGFELLLRLVDPWGALAYFGDIGVLNRSYIRPENRHLLPADTYEFNDWTATILDDYTRLVSATSPQACSIAFVGDSVTFGMGVDDDDTWVNLLAAELPDIQFKNAGLPGYNSEDVIDTIASLDADGYVYLIVNNDADPRLVITQERKRGSAWNTYIYMFEKRTSGLADATEIVVEQGVRRFDLDIAHLHAMDDVMMVGFENESLGADVTSIPLYTSSISQSDPHADVDGNKQIAAHMLPLVQDFSAEVCSGTSD